MNASFDGAGRAVALLADDDLGDALGFLVRLAVGVAVLLLAEDEHDDVGVLFEGAGLAQVGELRPVIGARLRARGDSCDSATIGTFSSFASPFSEREIDASSCCRFSKRPRPCISWM